MSIIQRIVQIFVERTVPLVTSLLASRLEGLIALEQAEQQDELEERARQFDAGRETPSGRLPYEPGPPGSTRTTPVSKDFPLSTHLEADSSDAPCLFWSPGLPTHLGFRRPTRPQRNLNPKCPSAGCVAAWRRSRPSHARKGHVG